jgi:hypothetical protein
MSQKILGDMKGIYAQMHEDAAFEAAVEDIVISVTYNMLSEGKTVDEIVEVLSSEDEQVILEHYAASQHSTTLTEDLDYDYYTEDFELVCERLGLIKGLFGLAKGGGKLLMKGGKALVKGAPPVAKKVAAGVGRGARVVKAKIGRAIGPKGRQALGKVSNVVKNVGVPVAAGAAGYMLGKGSSEAEAEAPKPEAPKDTKPAYPGGQTKPEGEAINKKYQELRTAAVDTKGKIKDPEAVKKAEKYGKEQWAKLYPNLAAKVKPDGTQKGTGQSQMEKDAEELRSMQKASQERQEADKKKVKKEAYEVVLDYLLSEGHADTVEEAHYVMMQMDAENIQSIVAESGYLPDKKSQKEDEKKYNLSTGELPGRHKPVKRNPDGSLKTEQMMPPINPEAHRRQQRIEKATQMKKGTSGAESQAAGAAVKRLGGSGISLPPV